MLLFLNFTSLKLLDFQPETTKLDAWKHERFWIKKKLPGFDFEAWICLPTEIF